MLALKVSGTDHKKLSKWTIDVAGANEIALDMCSRVVVDHLHNLGRTFRLFLDGFSHKMTNEVGD